PPTSTAATAETPSATQPRTGSADVAAATASATALVTTSAAPASDRAAAIQPAVPMAATTPATVPDTDSVSWGRPSRRSICAMNASTTAPASTVGRCRSTGSPGVKYVTAAPPAPQSATTTRVLPGAGSRSSDGQPSATR